MDDKKNVNHFLSKKKYWRKLRPYKNILWSGGHKIIGEQSDNCPNRIGRQIFWFFQLVIRSTTWYSNSEFVEVKCSKNRSGLRRQPKLYHGFHLSIIYESWHDKVKKIKNMIGLKALLSRHVIYRIMALSLYFWCFINLETSDYRYA